MQPRPCPKENNRRQRLFCAESEGWRLQGARLPVPSHTSHCNFWQTLVRASSTWLLNSFIRGIVLFPRNHAAIPFCCVLPSWCFFLEGTDPNSRTTSFQSLLDRRAKNLSFGSAEKLLLLGSTGSLLWTRWYGMQLDCLCCFHNTNS